MPDHARAQELAAISIDFDLTVDERAELDLHLETCASCGAHLDGLRVDARAFADLPRRDAPERVRRRVAPDPRPAWGTRFRLAAVVVGVFVVAVGIFAGTGGLPFGAGPDTGAVEPTNGAPALQAPGSSPGPAASQTPAASVEPSHVPATPAPGIPRTPWLAVDDQPAFDPKAVTPEKDTSKPRPPLNCKDCGDTSVFARRAVVRAAVETDDGIVAVGYGCVGGHTVTCQADVWRSPDGHAWEAVPNDGSLDAGSDNSANRETGMIDVVLGPRGIVAGGSVSRADGRRATIWTSPDGRRWQPIALDHQGDGTVTAVAAGPTTLVAVGRVRTDAGVVAAVWLSPEGRTWEPAAEIEGAAVGRFDGDDEDVAGMFDVTWAGDRFVAVGAACSSRESCRIAAWTSPDGRSWTQAANVAAKGRMRSVAYLGSRLVAVGDNGWGGFLGRAWTSTDATKWIPAKIKTTVGDQPPALNAVVAVGAGAIAVGDGYAVRTSDGRTWTRLDDEVLGPGRLDPRTGSRPIGRVFGLATVVQGIMATGQLSGDLFDDDGETVVSPPAIWILPYR